MKSIKKSPEYRALLKAKNAAARAHAKSLEQGRALVKEWVEVDRVNIILVKALLAEVKNASSVLRVIAQVNDEMKGMDLVQKCVNKCDAEAFQAVSVLKARGLPVVAP